MLTVFAKLLKALNSETAPGQIALAFSLAMIIGLTPFWSLHNALVLLLACVLRVHFGSFLVGLGLFSIIAWLVDPISRWVGEFLLLAPSLQTFWTLLYQSHFWRISGFNHTLTLGGLVLSLVAFVPVTLLIRQCVMAYRARLLTWVATLKIAKMLKATKLFNVYQRLAG